MIELRNISRTYVLGKNSIPVLKGISLVIGAKEFVAIMGPSGSGKSTLMNIIGCLDLADGGSYHLEGRPVAGASEDDLAHIRRHYFGFVFQLFNLVPRINARRNVELPMVYAKVPSLERRNRAEAVLARLGLSDRGDHFPSQLSGGQQQRVAIARALVNDPKVLIADEPTGSLDSKTGREIMQIFSELYAGGKTIILVTHEESVAAYAYRVIRLRDGVIEKEECR